MRSITRAYKTELALNNKQVTACKKHAGAARYAYNWGLNLKQKRYKATGKSPSAMELHRELNALKKSDLPWLYKVSKCAPQQEQTVLTKVPCGLVMDRDLNAAINLSKLAGSSPASLNACGEERAGRSRKASVKRASQAGTCSRKKQEPNALYLRVR